MTFVNEKISEADKRRIDFSQVESPFGRLPVDPNEWTYDRERDIGLFCLGVGDSEFPHFFVLYWKGVFKHVRLFFSFIGNAKTYDLEITWYLKMVEVVNGVDKEKVLEILKEALFVYGYFNPESRHKIKDIHFKFDKIYNQAGE
jgi:hypothetical protein